MRGPHSRTPCEHVLGITPRVLQVSRRHEIMNLCLHKKSESGRAGLLAGDRHRADLLARDDRWALHVDGNQAGNRFEAVQVDALVSV